MKPILQRLLPTLFAAALLAASAISCKNTAHGAGKDIENMGDKIQEKTD